MNHNRAFHIVISRLMKPYHIDTAKAEQKGHDVYIITLDDETPIFLMGNQPGYLNIMSPFISLEPDVVPPANVLLSLLSMNNWNARHPVFTLAIDTRKKKVTLSSRQPLIELDEGETHKLVSTFIETVSTLKVWIHQQMTSSTGAKKMADDTVPPRFPAMNNDTAS
ncbi:MULTISPECIES: hypothetical protein [unclassified Brenneria]|uniref:hypothetical protein n=1 Tax=unclassified Brenneria TaxID=2634434 RepID=UPI0029C5227D|nr:MULTISPECIES: hypothetical protein [unclassified Brenneria]MDX5628070.1 hypothetical protein [Brenneria sp. L3-3Z]MDX5694910.1 hypothetical protein [Brenneria sp. L4-2C]MEE3660699.1 hypothetical protein [Brenneria sp. g21c3]